LIDHPHATEPHGTLHAFGESKVFANEDIDTYECRVCHTRFKRTEAKPSHAVVWNPMT
jgi:hypothetical protein